MTDDNGQTAVDGVADTGTATATPVPLVGSDGKFGEKWVETLPEELRGEKSLQVFKDLPSFAKSYVNAQRMIGKNKVAIPGETSTPEEWEAFYEAGGRPKTAEDYGFKIPDEIPEEYRSPEILKEYQALAHKIGLSKKQADALFAFNNGNVLSGLKNMKADRESQMQELVDGLRKEWGAAYDERVHLGNVAIEQGAGGNDEFKDRLAKKFGNDPDFIRFASALGAKFAEHGVRGQPTPTPGDIQDKINELMATDAYNNRANPGHQAAVDKVQRLFQQRSSQTG